MPDSIGFREPLLVNTIGHCAGVVLFGLVLYLLLHDRRRASLAARRLPVAIALLAQLWNLGSLAALAAAHYQWAHVDLLVATSFSILSLLPALLLHLSLGSTLPAVSRAGYVLSVAAVVMHAGELRSRPLALSQAALWTITLGFGLLTVIAIALLALRAPRGNRQTSSRLFGAMSLFLFAVSFAHFSTGHGHLAWSGEVAVHHAGIPLALFVLLQDYRFLMLDAFLRLLVNTLAAAGFTTVAIVIERQFQLVRRAAGDPLLQGLLAVAICLLLVLFAQVRWLLQRWLTRAVFRRPDLDGTVQGIQKLGALAPEEATFVQQAAELAREYTSAEAVLVRDSGTPEGVLARPTALPDRRDPGASLEAPWAEVIVPLRFSRGDHMEILLGRRRGGRRYLSEELEGLDRLAAAIVEQVERLRNSEMQRLVSQAELRALQAQINPHFLFNSLNTLYGTIPRGAAEARRTVVNLADIFRYFLQSEKVFLPLSEELRIVEAYLEIESLRLGKRLRKEICVDPAALPVPIPMLSLQPLVENAVKHGIAASPDPGCVSVRAEMTEGGLRIRVGDSGSGRANNPQAKTGSGLGLENVRRRLKLCYGPQCDLAVSFSPTGSSVEFVIPAAVSELVRS